MQNLHETGLWALLELVAGTVRTVRLFEALTIHPELLLPRADRVTRKELAQALNMLLFEDVIRRVPMAAAYVGDAVREGRKLTFDHGALRTVACDCGALPPGYLAFARILEPLGFVVRDRYPLEQIAMTGRAFAHEDLPEHIAQFFVSELHPECFTDTFQAAVLRTVGTSRDPLPLSAKALLAELTERRSLGFDAAAHLLPNLVGCFDRHHQEPTWADYQAMLRESKEMAWIATEGNAFNHATDRVASVEQVADEQRRLGRPMKDLVEVSKSGRVRQTAFRAALVERLFVGDDGRLRTETVPGSFHEFITRDEEAPGVIDLRFDAGNATAIFKMTQKP